MKIYLDLLPQEKKKQLKRKKIFRLILREEALYLLPILMFIVILGDIYYVLNLQRNSSVAASSLDMSQSKYQELSGYENTFAKVNVSVAALSKIQDLHLHWLNVLRQLSSAAPDGVTISDFSTKDYQVFLVGKAATRDDLLNFKSNLEGSTCFQNVNVPLSNLVVKDDVDFQMDFVITQDCLKKQ